MRRIISFTLLCCFILLAGCKEATKYDDKDVAAIIRGEELTVGELRFLYPDDQILDNLEGTIKGKLAMQEAKAMQLDISEEPTVHVQDVYPAEDSDTEIANGTRDFAEAQAKKFNMEPEKYFERTQEMSHYVMAYISEMIGELEDNPEEYTELGNQLLDDLYEDNLDEIEILME
ncbi:MULTISPECIES: hypothetical protein [unclassified Oceanobacillus]|uniref:hypothetical protein n=1 Tax=unclassified Oceanobacillus TaxID=2630292 RepID=UPI00300E1110